MILTKFSRTVYSCRVALPLSSRFFFFSVFSASTRKLPKFYISFVKFLHHFFSYFFLPFFQIVENAQHQPKSDTQEGCCFEDGKQIIRFFDFEKRIIIRNKFSSSRISKFALHLSKLLVAWVYRLNPLLQPWPNQNLSRTVAFCRTKRLTSGPFRSSGL